MTAGSAGTPVLPALRSALIPGLCSLLLLLGLYWISLQNYLFFHVLVEFAGIAVAFTIFIIVWNTRRVITNTFFLIVGISFLFTGGMDLLHTLAYNGMGVFSGFDANIPTQLWIAARYFQSITFFIAALCIGKDLTKERDFDLMVIFSSCAIATILLVASIVVIPVFPVCYTEGNGLTLFKIASEYCIALILVAAIVMIYRQRSLFDDEVWKYLIAALLFLILGELAFTSYVSVYSSMNAAGHLARLVSVYFFYRAFVVVGLTRPYHLVFRELMESQNALRESEKRYATTLDVVSDGLWEWNVPEGTAVFSNNYYRLLGYEPGELPNTYQEWCSYVHPLDLPGFEAELNRHIKGGTRFAYDLRMRMKNGEWKWISTRGGGIEWDSQGTVLRMAGTHHDITDRKNAEAALFDQEENYRTLLQVIPVPFCLVSDEGVLVYVNDRFTRQFGYTHDDVHTLAEWWVLAYPDEHYRSWVMKTWEEDMHQAVLNGTDIQPREYRVTCRNHEERIVEISGIILGDQFMATFVDVTERRLAEEALREANRKLNILNSITRHDILNQLMGLNGYIELMKMKINDAELLGYITKQQGAATAIRRQIEFTRFYQDIGMAAAEWYDVEETIASALQQIQPAGISFDLHVEGLEIYADPLVEKVFYNLMENSLRHGERVTRMGFSYEETPDGLTLTYQDDGVGITEEDRKKLFQKGFGKNTGLGLFLSREILAITGIQISENGESGKGVRFEMRVPKGAYRFRQQNRVNGRS